MREPELCADGTPLNQNDEVYLNAMRLTDVLGRKQLAKKMSGKRSVLESLGLDGQSPGRLTAAEFIDRSSAPRALRSARPSTSILEEAKRASNT